MIRQIINVDNHWRVIVYYNVNYALHNFIKRDISLPVEEFDDIFNALMTKAKAVTINLYDYKTSIVLFKRHNTEKDYINSLVHEAEHIKEAMLNYYNVDNYGEPPAYTIGFLIGEMYKVFRTII